MTWAQGVWAYEYERNDVAQGKCIKRRRFKFSQAILIYQVYFLFIVHLHSHDLIEAIKNWFDWSYLVKNLA